MDKLLWWLEREGIASCGLLEVKGFMTYLRNGHLEPGGRFGNPQSWKPLAARSLKDWHINLVTFFRFLVTEGYVDVSPMEGLHPPIHRPDQVQPFTEEQVQALLRAARKSKYSQRDEALVLFLLDTGVRASELCGLRMEDVDVVSRKATVLGKGNKHRAIYYGWETSRAL